MTLTVLSAREAPMGELELVEENGAVSVIVRIEGQRAKTINFPKPAPVRGRKPAAKPKAKATVNKTVKAPARKATVAKAKPKAKPAAKPKPVNRRRPKPIQVFA